MVLASMPSSRASCGGVMVSSMGQGYARLRSWADRPRLGRMRLFSRKPKRLVLPLGEVVSTHSFDDGRHEAVQWLRPRQPLELELRRQPDNEVDRNAVQLHSEQGPVAYLPHDDAVRYARILDRIGQPLWVQAMLMPGDQWSPVHASLPSARAANAWLKQQGLK